MVPYDVVEVAYLGSDIDIVGLREHRVAEILVPGDVNWS